MLSKLGQNNLGFEKKYIVSKSKVSYLYTKIKLS